MSRVQPVRPSVRRRAAVSAAAVAAAATAGLCAAPAAHAAATNYYWDPAGSSTTTNTTNGGGSGTWNTTSPIWYVSGAADVPWVNGNTAIFNNTGGTVTLGVPISALDVELLSTGYTIAPTATNTLTLTSVGTGTASAIYSNTSGGGTNTIGGPILFTAASGSVNFVTVAAENVLNLTGNISSSSPTNDAFTVTGGGTVNFSGNVATNGTAGTSLLGKFNINGGTTFNTSGTLNLANGTYVGVDDAIAGSTLNVTAGTISTNGIVLFVGAGSGATAASGTFNVSGGTANFGGLNVGNGFNGTGDGTGTAIVTGSGSVLNSGLIRLGSTKAGVGTLSLLNGGTLNTSASITLGTGSAGSGGSGTVVFNNGTLVATAAAAGISSPVIVNILDGGATYNTSTFANTISSNIAGGGTNVGGLTKLGTGTLTLTGSNTYGGSTTVSAGVLSATVAPALPSLASGKLAVASGAELVLRTSNGSSGFTSANIDSVIGNGDLASGAILGLDTTNSNFSYGSAITSPISLQKLGANTLFLTGANSYSGSTNLSAGLLAVGTGSLGTGVLNFNGGGIASSDATARTITNVVSQNGVSTFTFGATDTATGALTFTDTTAIDVGAAATRNFVVNVPTTLSQGFAGTTLTSTKSGTGTFILNGDSTGLTGTFTVGSGSGRTQLGNSNALGTATINVNGQNADTAQLALSGGITVTNTINLVASRNDPTAATAAGTAHVDNVSGNNTVTSAFPINGGGAGDIFQSDAGTLTLSGNLTGNNAGTSFNRPYYFTGAGNGLVSGNIADKTAANTTAFGASVVKYGTGTWTLTGANTYAAGTTVLAGTLRVNNTAGSGTGTGTVTVGDGANASTGVLAGTGTISTASATVVKVGGTITAGDGIAPTDRINKLTLGTLNASGGSYVVKLDGTQSVTTTAGSGASGTPGMANDELLISSLTSNGANPALTVSPVLLTAGASTFTNNPGRYSYVIAQGPAAAFDALFSNIAVAQTSGSGTFSLGTLAVGSTNEDLVLDFSTAAAPEPTSLLLAGLAAAPLVLGRRRRRQA